MKGTYIAALWIFLLVGFKYAEMQEKKYSVEFTQNEWQARYNWIEVAKAQLKKSKLPVDDVLFITDSLLGKFQLELAQQLQPQFAQDTIKKKTK